MSRKQPRAVTRSAVSASSPRFIGTVAIAWNSGNSNGTSEHAPNTGTRGCSRSMPWALKSTAVIAVCVWRKSCLSTSGWPIEPQCATTAVEQQDGDQAELGDDLSSVVRRLGGARCDRRRAVVAHAVVPVSSAAPRGQAPVPSIALDRTLRRMASSTHGTTTSSISSSVVVASNPSTSRAFSTAGTRFCTSWSNGSSLT